MSENMITVTSENFEQKVLGADAPVLLDFWAPWCTYCRRIEPAVEQLSGDLKGKLYIGKVNVDEQRELSVRCEIDTIPSLLLFRDGEQQGEKLIAPGSRTAIEDWLEENGIS